jgi:hypothetical protein
VTEKHNVLMAAIRGPRAARRVQTHRNELLERHSIFRFYDGASKLFDNLSLWVVPYKVGMEMTDRQQILNFPKDGQPLASSFAHIFPSIASLPDLSEQFFHIATVTPDDGVRIIYSLIFDTPQPVHFTKADANVILPERSLIILALESQLFHPCVFRELLTHFYNFFTSGHLFAMEESEFDEYWMPERSSHKSGDITLTQFPYDVSPDAEIGRLLHFAFASFPVKQIVSLVLHMLGGYPVLVTSVCTGRLSLGCFALVALLLPIQ